jgi:hypothetical protein
MEQPALTESSSSSDPSLNSSSLDLLGYPSVAKESTRLLSPTTVGPSTTAPRRTLPEILALLLTKLTEDPARER